MKCFECEAPAKEMHHVVPKSKGGTKMIPLCYECHGKVHGIKRMHISELTKEGLQKARERGVKLGSPRSYLTDEGRKKAGETKQRQARENENNQKAFVVIKKMINNGNSLREAANYLNTTGYQTAKGGLFTATQIQRIYKLFSGRENAPETKKELGLFA